MLSLGPVVAYLISRFGLRIVMLSGALISTIGYTALAFSPSMTIALGICAVFIGPGVALLSSLPPAMLVSSWYPDARGRAMGIAYLPILTTFIPLIGIHIIQSAGLSSFYMAMAALHLMLSPIMAAVSEPPSAISVERPVAGHGSTAVTVRAVLASGFFWLILLGDGILNGTNIAGSAHIVPVAVDYGHSQEVGALLLSVSGGASIVGSLLAGYSCDRIGAARTLSVAALGLGLSWAVIATSGWLPSLSVSAFIVGMCGAAVFPPVSALVVQVFGIDALPKTLSMLGIMALPFTFSMSPAAGWLRDAFGSYTPVAVIFVSACAIAATSFFLLSRLTRTVPNVSDASKMPEAMLATSNINVQNG